MPHLLIAQDGRAGAQAVLILQKSVIRTNIASVLKFPACFLARFKNNP